MKKLVFLLFVILIICLYCGGNYITSIEIVDWYDNKDAAISLTFDDGTDDHIYYAVPLLEEMGFKATFYLITSNINDWQAWDIIHEKGHEIGSHTVSHLNLKHLSLSEMEEELKKSYEIIIKNINGANCLSIAYPYGGVNDEIVHLSMKYYIAGRGARKSKNYINTYKTMNLFGLQSIGLWEQTNIDQLNNLVQETINSKGWLIETVHGIQNYNDSEKNIRVGWKPVDFNLLERHYNFLKNLSDKLWIAPVAEIASYINEKINSSIIFYKNKRNSYIIEIKYLNYNELCIVPVTLRINCRKGISIKSVMQGDKRLSFRCAGDSCYVNIKPNEEAVKIEF
jgi:peptidoglycan/xylan/chitin deacetylase (PgdA/CDA1 family)